MKTRFFNLLLMAALGLGACEEKEAVRMTGISVSPESVADLPAGETLQLTATSIPADAAQEQFLWSSEDMAVATVSAAGLVRGVSPGSATVKVRCAGISRPVSVTVSARVVPLTGLTVSPEAVSLVVEGTQELTVTKVPGDATGVTLTYTCTGNGSIATVTDGGVIAAISPGAATVTVTASAEGVTPIIKQIPVTVTEVVVPLTGLTVTPGAVNLVVEGIQQLSATIIPETATGVTLTYSCTGNGSIATVTDGGLVAAISPGAATVTVTASAEGVTPIIKLIPVTVTPPPPPPCETTSPAATAHEWLRLTAENANQCTMNGQGDYDEMIYTGGGNDPWALTAALTKAINSDVAYIKFEYTSDRDVEGQVFAFPQGEDNWYTGVNYVRTDAWACKVIALPLHVSHQLVAGDRLRFDLNPDVPQTLRIRSLEILYEPYTPPYNPYSCANVSANATAHDYLRLTNDVNGPNCTMSNMGDHDAITYLGGSGDPWVLSTAVSQDANAGLAYVRFEYKSNRDVDNCELFVFPSGQHWSTSVHYARTNEWTCMSILIPSEVTQRLVAGSKLRFDLNPGEVQVLRIKNLEIQFEPPASQPGPAINIEEMIGWFYDRMYRGTCYNMNARYEVGGYEDLNGNGCVEGDCSSAVMYAVRWAGAADWGALNTDSMHAWLAAHGFQVVSEGAGKIFYPQRGDIFIWGRIGQSGGAAGHTGVFLDGDNIIHMSAGCSGNGICVSNYNSILYANDGDNTYEYLYRYVQ